MQSSVWDAGPVYEAGQYSGLIFNESNVHKQCGKCNRFLHGNLLNYRLGLVKRYGQNYVDKLEAKASANRNRKYTKFELIEIANEYKSKLKLYK
jgi:hypothetical protein